MKTTFLRVVLVNVLFALALAGAALSYHGHVHSVALVAIAAVLTVYTLAAVYAALLAWRTLDGRACARPDLAHLDRAVGYLPKLAMLGTVSGFLVALSADAGDVTQRVQGASTALASTFVGIACMVVLEWQEHLLSRGAR